MAESEVKNTEVEVQPEAQAQAEVAPKVETPVEAEASGEAGEAGEAKPTAAAPKPDWRDERLARVTAQRHALQKELDEARKQLEQRSGEAGADYEARVQAEAERLADIRAEEKLRQQEFTKAANAAVSEGRKNFADFDQKLNEFARIADQSDPASVKAYAQLVTSLIDTGVPEKLIYNLGQDLNEATRLMNLPPAKQGIELARMADRLEADGTKSVSNAPKPIKPIGGRAAPHTSIDPTDPERADNLSTAEWFRRREEQVKAARAAR